VNRNALKLLLNILLSLVTCTAETPMQQSHVATSPFPYSVAMSPFLAFLLPFFLKQMKKDNNRIVNYIDVTLSRNTK